jgi:AsmA protein
MKTLLKIVAILAMLVVLVVIGLVLFINTGQYKTALETAVADATGYRLTIAGDLGLDIFPNLGLTLNDVRLQNPAVPQELASTSAVVLRVSGSELIRGRLLIQEFLAEDFHINYYIREDGSTIWDVAGSPNDDADDDSGSGVGDVDVSFQRIRIANTSIDFQDLAQGVRYQFAHLNLESRDTNINGRPSEPVAMGFRSRVSADLENGNVSLSDINFNVTPLLLQGEVNLVNLGQAPQFTGNLRSNNFDLNGLLQSLGMSQADSELTAPQLGQQQLAAISLQFSGNQSEATVPSLTIQLGDALIEGDASIRFATGLAPMNVSYSITGGAIDLTPFMASTEAEPSAEPVPTASAASPDTALPVDLLGSMDLLGSIALESITAGDFLLEDINVFTNIEDRVLDIEIAPVTTFGGTVQGSLRLDARNTTPILNSQFQLERINLVQLAPVVSRFNTVTGFLNVEAQHGAEGATVGALLDSLSGTTTFNIDENSVDIGVIKQMFTAISALSPTGAAIQQWPDVMRFSSLNGAIVLAGGLDANQQLALRMDNVDISGTGGIDLDAASFDYNLAFSILGPPLPQTIPINENYYNVAFPVQCSAAFAAEVSQYCSPDFARVREILTQMGSAAVRRRLEEEVSDQLPDAARSLLRSLRK